MSLHYLVKLEMLVGHLSCYIKKLQNLFHLRKRYTEFHQNRPSFIGDVTKKTFWSLFFLDTVYVYVRCFGVHITS